MIDYFHYLLHMLMNQHHHHYYYIDHCGVAAGGGGQGLRPLSPDDSHVIMIKPET